MIRVFYDGRCGMCSREINYYRRIAPQNICEWIDITIQPQPLLHLGIELQDGLKRLYTQNSDGKIYQGVDSFLLIWQQIPRFRWLACIVRTKLFYAIASFLYVRFATWHFTRMGYEKCSM